MIDYEKLLTEWEEAMTIRINDAEKQMNESEKNSRKHDICEGVINGARMSEHWMKGLKRQFQIESGDIVEPDLYKPYFEYKW